MSLTVTSTQKTPMFIHWIMDNSFWIKYFLNINLDNLVLYFITRRCQAPIYETCATSTHPRDEIWLILTNKGKYECTTYHKKNQKNVKKGPPKMLLSTAECTRRHHTVRTDGTLIEMRNYSNISQRKNVSPRNKMK